MIYSKSVIKKFLKVNNYLNSQSISKINNGVKNINNNPFNGGINIWNMCYREVLVNINVHDNR